MCTIWQHLKTLRSDCSIPSQRNDSMLIFFIKEHVWKSTWYVNFPLTLVCKFYFKYFSVLYQTDGWSLDCPQHSYYRCFWRVQKLKRLQRRRSLGQGNWARPKLPDSFFKVKSHSYWKQSCNHERLHIWNFVAFPYVFKLSCMCLVSFVIFHFPITKISPKCSAPLLVKNYLLSCSRISP